MENINKKKKRKSAENTINTDILDNFIQIQLNKNKSLYEFPKEWDVDKGQNGINNNSTVNVNRKCDVSNNNTKKADSEKKKDIDLLEITVTEQGTLSYNNDINTPKKSQTNRIESSPNKNINSLLTNSAKKKQKSEYEDILNYFFGPSDNIKSMKHRDHNKHLSKHKTKKIQDINYDQLELNVTKKKKKSKHKDDKVEPIKDIKNQNSDCNETHIDNHYKKKKTSSINSDILEFPETTSMPRKKKKIKDETNMTVFGTGNARNTDIQVQSNINAVPLLTKKKKKKHADFDAIKYIKNEIDCTNYETEHNNSLNLTSNANMEIVGNSEPFHHEPTKLQKKKRHSLTGSEIEHSTCKELISNTNLEIVDKPIHDETTTKHQKKKRISLTDGEIECTVSKDLVSNNNVKLLEQCKPSILHENTKHRKKKRQSSTGTDYEIEDIVSNNELEVVEQCKPSSLHETAKHHKKKRKSLTSADCGIECTSSKNFHSNNSLEVVEQSKTLIHETIKKKRKLSMESEPIEHSELSIQPETTKHKKNRNSSTGSEFIIEHMNLPETAVVSSKKKKKKNKLSPLELIPNKADTNGDILSPKKKMNKMKHRLNFEDKTKSNEPVENNSIISISDISFEIQSNITNQVSEEFILSPSTKKKKKNKSEDLNKVKQEFVEIQSEEISPNLPHSNVNNITNQVGKELISSPSPKKKKNKNKSIDLVVEPEFDKIQSNINSDIPENLMHNVSSISNHVNKEFISSPTKKKKSKNNTEHLINVEPNQIQNNMNSKIFPNQAQCNLSDITNPVNEELISTPSTKKKKNKNKRVDLIDSNNINLETSPNLAQNNVSHENVCSSTGKKKSKKKDKKKHNKLNAISQCEIDNLAVSTPLSKEMEILSDNLKQELLDESISEIQINQSLNIISHSGKKDYDLSSDEEIGVDYETQNVLSEKDIQMMEALDVCLPFKPPVLHTIETRISAGPKKEQEEEIKRLNIKYQKGNYTKADDEQIRANWNDFYKSHDMPDNPRLFFNMSQKTERKNCLVEPENRVKFCQYLARGLEHRLLWSVYKRFRTMYGEYRKGRFSPEEDKLILKCRDQSGCEKNSFAAISIMLNRERISVQKRYVDLKIHQEHHFQKISHNPTNKLKISVIKALMQELGFTNYKQLKCVEISLKVFRKVGISLGIAPLQLQRLWNATFHTQLFSKLRDSYDILKRLVDIMYEDKTITDFRNINYRRYQPHFEGVLAESFYKIFTAAVLKLPQGLKTNLKDCLQYMKNNPVYQSNPIQNIDVSDL